MCLGIVWESVCWPRPKLYLNWSDSTQNCSLAPEICWYSCSLSVFIVCQLINSRVAALLIILYGKTNTHSLTQSELSSSEMLPIPQSSLCHWKVTLPLLIPMIPALKHFQAVFPGVHIAMLSMLRRMCSEDEAFVKTAPTLGTDSQQRESSVL